VLQCVAVYVDDFLEGEAFDATLSREDLEQLKISKVSSVVMSCSTPSSELNFGEFLPYSAMKWSILQHNATHCNALQHSTLQHTATHAATHCNILQHTETPCNSRQNAAAHGNSLQHTATHCNALQHTATHCNTQQHTCEMK